MNRVRCSHSLCEEFYFSEQRYCSDLRYTLGTYREQICRRFDQKDIPKVFGNISDLIRLSEQLIQGIHKKVEVEKKEKEVEALASLFLSLREQFQAISDYISNLRNALTLLSNLELQNEFRYCIEVRIIIIRLIAEHPEWSRNARTLT